MLELPESCYTSGFDSFKWIVTSPTLHTSIQMPIFLRRVFIQLALYFSFDVSYVGSMLGHSNLLPFIIVSFHSTNGVLPRVS